MPFNQQLLHYGIFGPGLSGKTTLAKYLSREYWSGWRVKSLVLDPNLDQWGAQAFVTDKDSVFSDMVWNRERDCAIFIEEAAEMIARDNAQTHYFTRVRHRGHRLHVIGHSGSNLLPVQREQIHTLYLFKQTEAGAGLWAEQFTDSRIMEATTLRQYEFLYCRLYQTPRRLRLAL